MKKKETAKPKRTKKTKAPKVPNSPLPDRVRNVSSIRDLPNSYCMHSTLESAVSTGKQVFVYSAPVGDYVIIATEAEHAH